MKIDKISISILLLLLSYKTSAQKFLFKDDNFSMQVTINANNNTDSALVKCVFTNTSDKSIFIPVEVTLMSKWSKSRGAFILYFGETTMYSKQYNLVLKEVRKDSTIEENIKAANCFSDSTAVGIHGQYFKGIPAQSAATYRYHDISQPEQKWFEYYLIFNRRER